VIEEINPHLFIREKIVKIIALPFIVELEIELERIHRPVNNNIIAYS
jgi:hypothetical protein